MVVTISLTSGFKKVETERKISCREPVCFAPQYLLEIYTRSGLQGTLPPMRVSPQSEEYAAVQVMVLESCRRRGQDFRAILEWHNENLFLTADDIKYLESMVAGSLEAEAEMRRDIQESIEKKNVIQRGFESWAVWNAMIPVYGLFGDVERTQLLELSGIFDEVSQELLAYGRSPSSFAKLSLLAIFRDIGELVSDAQFHEEIGEIHYIDWKSITGLVQEYTKQSCTVATKMWLKMGDGRMIENIASCYIPPEGLGRILSGQSPKYQIIGDEPSKLSKEVLVVGTVAAGFSTGFVAAANQINCQTGEQGYTDTQTVLVQEALKRDRQDSAMPAVIGDREKQRVRRYIALVREIMKDNVITSETAVIREVTRVLLDDCIADLVSSEGSYQTGWQREWLAICRVLSTMSVFVQEVLKVRGLSPSLYYVLPVDKFRQGDRFYRKSTHNHRAFLFIQNIGAYVLHIGKIPLETEALFLTWLDQNLLNLDYAVLNSWPKGELIVLLY